jgi:hypothetical protein
MRPRGRFIPSLPLAAQGARNQPMALPHHFAVELRLDHGIVESHCIIQYPSKWLSTTPRIMRFFPGFGDICTFCPSLFTDNIRQHRVYIHP